MRDLKAAFAPALANHVKARLQAIAPPRGFQLITEMFPFARGSLELAVDRFLGRIEGLDGARADRQDSPARWIPLLVLSATGAPGAVAWRRRKEAEREQQACAPGLKIKLGKHGLPGLPTR